MKGSKSVSDPKDEEEIEVQYVKPIRLNTLLPQYSKEISRYQPSDKERVRAMKDALSAVRQFMSEGNVSSYGNLNTTTMKFENLFQVKLGTFLRKPQENLKVHK